jgi:hypothetical protein
MNNVFVCRPAEGEEHLLDSQWMYLLNALGVAEVTIGAINASTPVVVIQPRTGREVSGDVSLKNFVHPDGPVVYLFGGSHSVMRKHSLTGLNIFAKVYIPVSDDWELFSQQAAAMVLWDRLSRHG